MEDSVDQVSKRLADLEATVAKGFYENSAQFKGMNAQFEKVDAQFKAVDARFHEAELRDIALSRKIDVTADALRGDIRTVLDAVGSLADEMRRTTDSIRKEHAADRAVLTTALEQHAGRLHALEVRGLGPEGRREV